MSYGVTWEYYSDGFKGEPVEKEDFGRLLSLAVEILEPMTMYRVTEDNYSTFPEVVRRRITNAICAKIEYLEANGGSDLDNSIGMASASLGKFSYSRSAGASGRAEQSVYSPRALRILAPTGLLYRGGEC